MDRAERRSHQRIRVQIPCELELDGRRGTGTVRDVSAGGLCVQTQLEAQEGDEVRLQLHPKGQTALEIHALVWNVVGMRERSSGDRSMRIGFVLSDAPDAYRALLGARGGAPRAMPTPRPSARPARAPRAAARPNAHDAGDGRCGYRVRVRHESSSRTRSLLVFASSEDDARATALQETGSGWVALTVARQRS